MTETELRRVRDIMEERGFFLAECLRHHEWAMTAYTAGYMPDAWAELDAAQLALNRAEQEQQKADKLLSGKKA